MHFDDLLTDDGIGQCGKYQTIQYTLLCLPGILTAFHHLAAVFLAATPPFRCDLPSGVYNGTDTFQPQNEFHQSVIMQYINSTHSNDSLILHYPDECKRLYQNETCTSFTYDRTEMNNSITTDLNLVCGEEIKSTVSTAVYMSGVLVGALVLGFLSDGIGRKKTMVICLIFQGGCGVAVAFAPEYYSFIVLRFLTGAFSMGLFMTNYVLGMELVGPKYRMVTGVIMHYFFAIGFVALAGIAYATREWNILQIAISAPSFLFLVYIWIVPESARWLLAKDRPDEAEKVVQNAADVNGAVLPKGIFNDFKKETGRREGFRMIFSHKTILTRSAIIFLNWLVIAMTYYGLSLNSGNLGGSLFFNFMLGGLVEFPAYTVCFSVNKLGRKALHVSGMLIGGLACLGAVFVDLYAKDLDYSTRNALFITLNMTGKFGMSIAFCTVYLWSAELFPTSIRNTMMGISSTIARVGAIAAPFIADLGKFVPAQYSLMMPSCIFGSLTVLGGLLSILLPETNGHALPETIEEASMFPNHDKEKYGTHVGTTASTGELIDSKETKFY